MLIGLKERKRFNTKLPAELLKADQRPKSEPKYPNDSLSDHVAKIVATESGKFIPVLHPESVKIWLMESRILGFGIRNTAQGIRNLLRTDKYWNPVPGIPNPQRGIQNRRLSIPLHGAYCVHPPPSLV